MKSLLYVAPFFSFPPATGAELRAVHLAEQLCVDWKVTVLVRRTGADFNVEHWANRLDIQVAWLDCPWQSAGNNELARVFSARPPGFSALDPTCIADAMDTVCASHGRFDLIFLATQLTGQVLLKRPWQAPVVLDLYDLYTPLAYQRVAETPPARPYHWLFRLESIRISYLERRIISKAVLCLLPSETELEIARQLFPDGRFTVVPNGVNLPESMDVQYSAPQVLMIGSLHHKPNLEGFQWFHELVWPTIRSANLQARFCLVGGGQETLPPAVRDDPSLVLAGLVPDVKPYYEASCCAIVPVLRGGGTRLKLLEAMAWGIPVVTTSAGCAGVDHQDTLLVSDEPSAFAKNVLACLEDPARFAEQTRRAREVVAGSYTWDRIGADLRRRLETFIEPA